MLKRLGERITACGFALFDVVEECRDHPWCTSRVSYALQKIGDCLVWTGKAMEGQYLRHLWETERAGGKGEPLYSFFGVDGYPRGEVARLLELHFEWGKEAARRELASKCGAVDGLVRGPAVASA